MKERIYKITDGAGLHARPASLLVKAIVPFESEVLLEYKGKQSNVKSIIALMSLGIPKEASIKFIAKGSDADKVMERINEVMEKENLGVCVLDACSLVNQ
jgi:phosphocarrier protein HPr